MFDPSYQLKRSPEELEKNTAGLSWFKWLGGAGAWQGPKELQLIVISSQCKEPPLLRAKLLSTDLSGRGEQATIM